MKLTNIILGVILAAVLMFPLKLNQKAIIKSDNLKVAYDEALYNATNDSAKYLVYAINNYSTDVIAEGKKVDYKKVNLNLDLALNRFYETLFLNLNIDNNYAEQQALKYKIPIKIATGYDGYYLNYWQYGTNEPKEQWTKKKLYLMNDSKNNITINFTLNNYVYIEDLREHKKYEGEQESFKNKYPNSCFGEKFETVKMQVINQMIKRDLEYYTFYSNDIAKKNGWKLTFKLPYWGDRAINDIAFIAFIQGNTLTGQKTYDSYGFGTAKIVERKPVYGYEENNEKFYSPIKKGDVVFFDEFQAAKNGYKPDLRYYNK